MNKIGIIIASFALCSVDMIGQNPYEAERFATNDLNGSSRFVGMGGALGALGGDISTMSTNPAGTAMISKTDISFTASAVIGGTKGVLDNDKAIASIDQVGFVAAIPTYSMQGMTFGINVVKNRNHFLNIDTDIMGLNGMYSQTNQIANLANQSNKNDSWGVLAGMSAPSYNDDDEMTKGGILYDIYDDDDNVTYFGIPAEAAHYQRASSGSSMDVDVNMSFNIDSRFLIGATLGVYSVDKKRTAVYEELGLDGYYYDFTNYCDTKGSGIDFKLGTIIRPIEQYPFRIGVYIHTPVWYSLEDVNGSVLFVDDYWVDTQDNPALRYKLRTPWKFGVSMGTTLAGCIAVGAEYMYQDLSSCKYSPNGDGMDNYLRAQNKMMDNVLQGQHTFKVGMEVKPSSEFSVRCGYNYLSAPMKSAGYNCLFYNEEKTETDFCNWKETNRFTFGLGYRFKGGYFDLTYQYSSQKGDFYAFDEVNLIPTEIKNNRSQIMCTLGLRF